jgi:PHD/YefM family antitoxin component YafN of YafNO toxin-antitoxin module
VYTCCMSDPIGIRDARAVLGSLVRRAAISRERTAITDHGQVAAILINPQELADLEDELALVQYRLEQVSGDVPAAVPHEQVVREARGEAGDSAA